MSLELFFVMGNRNENAHLNCNHEISGHNIILKADIRSF